MSDLDHIPSGWRKLPLKRVADVTNSGCYGDDDETKQRGEALKAITTAHIDPLFGFKAENAPVRYFSRQEQSKFVGRPGDIFVVKSSGSNENVITGKRAQIKDETDLVFTNFLLRVRPNERADPRYLFHLLGSSLVHSRIKREVATTTYPNLNLNQYLGEPLPIPDLDTQKTIADFLDRETARIDQLIGKKKRLVALLGEKLEDDILRSITLGVDPDAELIPENDLEWTTHRPAHWKLFRLKHFFRENTQYSKDGQETLFSLRMKEGLVPHNDVSDKELLPHDLLNYKKVYPGQIVMNRMRAAIGLFGLADSTGIVSPDYSIFDVSPKAHAGYFLRLFKSEPMMAAFRLLSKGLGTGHSGFMRLNADNFGRIRVAVPELEEQRLISNHVEDRIAQITKLQAKNEQSIDNLKEYRSALITAAVTGQIDVTTWNKQGQTDRRLDQIEEEMSVREARA